MAFRKPITTLGGLTWWKNIRQDEHFIMQEHKTGTWPYTYRIILREDRKEIANTNDKSEIQEDWNYLKNHAVPQAEKGIDLGEYSDVALRAVMKVLVKLI